MKLIHNLSFILISSFIIHFYIIPYIVVNNHKYIRNNLGKVYTSIIFSMLMMFLEVMMHDYQYKVISLRLYMIFGVVLVCFIYLYKKQVAVNDKQFLEGMIEQHSQTLLMSEEILKKTNDYNITKLAKNIIQTQKDEIRIMDELLNK